MSYELRLMFRKRKRIGEGREAPPAGLSGRSGSSVVSKPMKQDLSPCRLARQETKFEVENAAVPAPVAARTRRCRAAKIRNARSRTRRRPPGTGRLLAVARLWPT